MSGKNETPKPKANSTPKKKEAVAAQEPQITLEQVPQHIEQLRAISTVAARLFTLLGGQLTGVSSAIPIEKGRDAVSKLKVQVKEHRDGMASAFNPLRDQIKHYQETFWEKNGEVIEAAARGYIERRVNERVRIEVDKALEVYRDYVANHEKNNEGLMNIMAVSDARAKNSLLHSKYANEQVTWFGGADPAISLGELVRADESHLAPLVETLGLSSDGEDTQATLNRTFHHLGIRYRAVPVRGSFFLMPSVATLG